MWMQTMQYTSITAMQAHIERKTHKIGMSTIRTYNYRHTVSILMIFDETNR